MARKAAKIPEREALVDALINAAVSGQTSVRLVQDFALAMERLMGTVYPADECHEDYGAVLWWHFPVCEPPIIGYGPGAGEKNRDGTPTDCARLIESGHLTHWSHIPVVWNGDGMPLAVGSKR